MSIPIIGSIVSLATDDVAKLGLDAVSSWVMAGTKAALTAVAGVVGKATSPNLLAGWFSSTYFRVAGLAFMLTVPFLFAAAIQAVLRSDLPMLLRAGLIDLPVAVIAVFLAAPVTMLLLDATDEMCAIVSNDGSSAAGALDRMAAGVAAASSVDGSAFLAVLMGVVVAMAAVVLMIELLIRAAAVYAVVLMLPLAFAALVWPARRIWAQRALEMLVALILSKFAIVAILSLAAAGIDAASLGQAGTLLTSMTLLVLGTFAPWALLRLIPFTELTAAVAGMSSEARGRINDQAAAFGLKSDPAAELLAALQQQPAQAVGTGFNMLSTADQGAGADSGETGGPGRRDGGDGGAPVAGSGGDGDGGGTGGRGGFQPGGPSGPGAPGPSRPPSGDRPAGGASVAGDGAARETARGAARVPAITGQDPSQPPPGAEDLPILDPANRDLRVRLDGRGDAFFGPPTGTDDSERDPGDQA